MPRLYQTEEEKRAVESRNGALQFFLALEEIDHCPSGRSDLTTDLLLRLQYRAIVGLYTCAGKFRDGPVYISGNGSHQPPDHSLVAPLVEDLCSYVQDNWSKTPIHLSAYTLWRLNWIHPFFGGNGRTSRAASYIVLCCRLNFRLPGQKTIPDYIVNEREAYLDALHEADVAAASGILNVSAMETLLESLLARQFLSVVSDAVGRAELQS